MFSEQDHHYMSLALKLAEKGKYTTHPNPRVGCVIVKDDKVVGQGYHQRAGEPHAEVYALRDAAEQAPGATAYVTLEPCSHTGRTPPCANALIQAGVKRVIAAMQDPNPLVAGSGLAKLQQAGIEAQSGLLEAQAQALNAGFIKRMTQGLPFVRVKLAMSLDGRTAMSSGESMWITGAAARQDVQRLRAQADAILTGSGTVLMDNPSLNVRLSAKELGITGEVRQLARVILDSSLSTPTDSKLLTLSGENWFFTLSNSEEKRQALVDAGADIVHVAEADAGRLNLKSVLQRLAERQINEVHVEAGATLCGALLEQGLVDEIVIYMAPHIMGSDARGLFNLPGLENMQDRINLKIQSVRAVGDDWRITARPSNLNKL